MILLLAALLAAVALALAFRTLAGADPRERNRTLVTLAVAALILGLGFLALTGRLHWLVALGAAALPLLRRGLHLLRYVPVFRSLFSAARSRGARDHAANGPMSRERALEILGLQAGASRDEILAAHRRLIQRLHPDRGGSDYLAQQLNEAKRRLLEQA